MKQLFRAAAATMLMTATPSVAAINYGQTAGVSTTDYASGVGFYYGTPESKAGGGFNVPIQTIQGYVGGSPSYEGIKAYTSTINNTFTEWDISFNYGDGTNPLQAFSFAFTGTDLSRAFPNSYYGTDFGVLLKDFAGGKLSYSDGRAPVTLVFSLPEMSTWAMMILGLAGVGIAVRRRRPERHSAKSISASAQ